VGGKTRYIRGQENPEPPTELWEKVPAPAGIDPSVKRAKGQGEKKFLGRRGERVLAGGM